MLDLVDRLSNRADPGFVSRTQPGQPAVRAAVSIRRACAADLAVLRDFFAGLSVRTRYLRFFGGFTVTPAMLRRLCDGGNVDSVVATTVGGAIVGHAMAADQEGQDGTTMTEIGVVVADGWQGQGVGSALARALIAGAQARGATIVAMDVLASNERVLAMIAGHWPAVRIDHSPDCVTIHAPLRRHQEERLRAELSSQRRPGPPGASARDQRPPARTAAQLPVGGSRALSGSRP
jgi:ribosomal protein S18 acetylase RimI-like enzyme